MLVLDVNKLTKSFGFGNLFEDLSFSLNDGEAISIVGANGSGKSTLLKIILGKEKADKGSVNIRKGAKVAYLDQTGSSIDDDRPVKDVLYDAFSDLLMMEKRLNELQEKLSENLQDEEYEEILRKYCNLLDRFAFAGGYEIEKEIQTVAGGLKIDKSLLDKSFNSLSGGEKTIVALAKALLIKPDLFLLDEPTNHLDTERIEWLEGYLKSFKGAIVIVSHDRYFLDRMSKKILSIENGKGKVYSTNYTGFLEEREREREKQLAQYNMEQNAIKRLEEQIKYFSQKGMEKNSSTLCDRAHSLQTQLERIKKKAVARPKVQKPAGAKFDEQKKTSKRVIETKDFSVILPNGQKILDRINIYICSGERVAIIGKNGSGKSTLIKAIMGVQDLEMQGEIIVGPSVKIGYLPQIITFPDENQSVLEYFENESGLSEERSRKILAGMQFYKNDVTKRVKNLSGGEKMRIKLALLLQQKINTLIFDEPTNHIDIPTKEMLEEALGEFEGTLIFISHDRYFINKFAHRSIEIENGKATVYLGGYDFYKEHKK